MSGGDIAFGFITGLLSTIVFFVIAGLPMAYKAGSTNETHWLEKQAVLHHVGQYNNKTGSFEWTPCNAS